MKKKKAASENYLERIPKRPEGLKWTTNEKGIVTLLIENTGVFNRLAQKFLHKPKVTQIHLDEMGSFVWPILDGKQNIEQLGEPVRQQFGEKAEPLYPRLAKFFQVLDSYHFIVWEKKNGK